ncbi:MAG: trypsin-like serine protease [Gemmatimonadetes bacterium]|jgi:serine protease Do|nr:trypsin-like serine protease [Gemmatimonadota bacterium]MBT7859129.1 trypsin-like serine protease [Gemmatimonadota bacterium]
MTLTRSIRFGVAAWGLLLTPLLGMSQDHAADESQDISSTRRNAVVRAVERVQPSVVSIHVVHRERVYYEYRDPTYQFLFGPRSPLSRRLYGVDQDRISRGSGFVVEGQRILTNAHVLGPKNRISIDIALPDGRVIQATDGSVDHMLDLAVLEVAEEGLPVAPLGDSGDILVGEWAIAIGNPLDLGPTVSIGVISALDRDFEEPQGNYHYRDMIQTDAAINHGNSGGPLVNALGEVIGINSFIIPGGGERGHDFGSIGIGFAIPIDAAQRFLDEIQTHGRVRVPWHGIIDLQNLTSRLAQYLDLDSTDGALIHQIAVDSPAYMADLTRGDVILAINGETVHSSDEARGILTQLRVSETCTIDISRSGKPRLVTFRVEERPRAGSRLE